MGKHQGNGVQAIAEIVANHGNGYQKTNTRAYMEPNTDANAVQKTMEGQTRSAEKTYCRMLVFNILIFMRVVN